MLFLELSEAVVDVAGCPECSCKEEQYGLLIRGPDFHLFADENPDAPHSTAVRATEWSPGLCTRYADVPDPLPCWRQVGYDRRAGPVPETPVHDDLVVPVVRVRSDRSNDREVGGEIEDRGVDRPQGWFAPY